MNASAAKLYLMWKTLTCRNSEPALFQQGNYVPLKVTGQRSEHVVAFAREHEGRTAIVAVPRLCATLLGDESDTVCEDKLWADTCLELASSGAECFHNIFTGECLPVSGIEHGRVPIASSLRHFPVALLLSEPPGDTHDIRRVVSTDATKTWCDICRPPTLLPVDLALRSPTSVAIGAFLMRDYSLARIDGK